MFWRGLRQEGLNNRFLFWLEFASLHCLAWIPMFARAPHSITCGSHAGLILRWMCWGYYARATSHSWAIVGRSRHFWAPPDRPVTSIILANRRWELKVMQCNEHCIESTRKLQGVLQITPIERASSKSVLNFVLSKLLSSIKSRMFLHFADQLNQTILHMLHGGNRKKISL